MNQMSLYLGILTFSFVISSLAIVPFIDLLYKLRLVRIGGGLLIIAIVSLLYIFTFSLIQRLGVYITSLFAYKDELNIVFFSFISFGILGFFKTSKKIFFQTILSLIVSLLIFFNLKIDIINIPFWGVLHLGWLFVPITTGVILLFSHAFDITSDYDGLSSGVLLINLIALWSLSLVALDTPLSILIALWIGALIAFLYFNVYPARIRLGEVGSLAFGGSFAVIGILLGKMIATLTVGGLFVLVIICLPFLKMPLHHWFANLGWPKSKIMMRSWLAAIILAIFGLWLARL